jgi:oligopeptide/dipeptide ABC transporter ATP-binding protein
MPQPALNIEDLSVSYRTEGGLLQALRHINLKIDQGRIVGIVGESGCGKSTLISSIIRLLAPNAQVDNGSIRWQGNDLLDLDEKTMRSLRGDEISMVFQDPMTSLNPVLTIGRQMTDIQFRDNRSRAEKRSRAVRLLERVDIPNPVEQLNRYPHQLSGGMRQRVAIAMALMTQPGLLIADEPTTALDATLEVQIIRRLRDLQRDFGCAILFISHHLGVIAELCEEVVVMYAGEIVEHGPMRDVFLNPKHPYTQKLLECDPARIEQSSRHLPVIKGQLPDLVDLPDACVFCERCDQAIDRCHDERPQPGSELHSVACHLVSS